MMTTLQLSHPARDPFPATILIVEDDPILRFTLAMELSKVGFAVREAASADEAETVLETGPQIDVVVTDIEMPGARDGIALARSVRAFHPQIRLVVVSGIIPDKGIVGVADAFFGKPYDFDRLILRIRSLLASSRGLAHLS